MKWIIVKDELPKEGTHILVSDGKDVRSSWYNGTNFMIEKNSSNYYTSPTHWMELPKPPKK